MSDPRLLLITGSTRRRSANTAAVHTARVILGGDSAEVYDGLGELPAFGSRRGLPSAVGSLRQTIAASDVVVFCTPVYAGRLPDSLVNLLQWASGPVLERKPATWIEVIGPGSSDAVDAALAHALRRAGARVLSSRGVSVPVAAEAIGADGLIADPLTISRLATALGTIVAEVSHGRPSRPVRPESGRGHGSSGVRRRRAQDPSRSTARRSPPWPGSRS